jgi:hypothetical protein
MYHVFKNKIFPDFELILYFVRGIYFFCRYLISFICRFSQILHEVLIETKAHVMCWHYVVFRFFVTQITLKVLTVRELRNSGWNAGLWVTSCCATEKEIYTLVKNFMLLSILKNDLLHNSFILQTLICSSCMFSR